MHVVYPLLEHGVVSVVAMVEGERQPGRRKWIDDILMWSGQDIKGAMTMTEDRDKWRTSVDSFYGPC